MCPEYTEPIDRPSQFVNVFEVLSVAIESQTTNPQSSGAYIMRDLVLAGFGHSIVSSTHDYGVRTDSWCVSTQPTLSELEVSLHE